MATPAGDVKLPYDDMKYDLSRHLLKCKSRVEQRMRVRKKRKFGSSEKCLAERIKYVREYPDESLTTANGDVSNAASTSTLDKLVYDYKQALATETRLGESFLESIARAKSSNRRMKQIIVENNKEKLENKSFASATSTTPVMSSDTTLPVTPSRTNHSSSVSRDSKSVDTKRPDSENSPACKSMNDQETENSCENNATRQDVNELKIYKDRPSPERVLVSSKGNNSAETREDLITENVINKMEVSEDQPSAERVPERTTGSNCDVINGDNAVMETEVSECPSSFKKDPVSYKEDNSSDASDNNNDATEEHVSEKEGKTNNQTASSFDSSMTERVPIKGHNQAEIGSDNSEDLSKESCAKITEAYSDQLAMNHSEEIQIERHNKENKTNDLIEPERVVDENEATGSDETAPERIQTKGDNLHHKETNRADQTTDVTEKEETISVNTISNERDKSKGDKQDSACTESSNRRTNQRSMSDRFQDEEKITSELEEKTSESETIKKDFTSSLEVDPSKHQVVIETDWNQTSVSAKDLKNNRTTRNNSTEMSGKSDDNLPSDISHAKIENESVMRSSKSPVILMEKNTVNLRGNSQITPFSSPDNVVPGNRKSEHQKQKVSVTDTIPDFKENTRDFSSDDLENKTDDKRANIRDYSEGSCSKSPSKTMSDSPKFINENSSVTSLNMPLEVINDDVLSEQQHAEHRLLKCNENLNSKDLSSDKTSREDKSLKSVDLTNKCSLDETENRECSATKNQTDGKLSDVRNKDDVISTDANVLLKSPENTMKNAPVICNPDSLKSILNDNRSMNKPEDSEITSVSLTKKDPVDDSNTDSGQPGKHSDATLSTAQNKDISNFVKENILIPNSLNAALEKNSQLNDVPSLANNSNNVTSAVNESGVAVWSKEHTPIDNTSKCDPHKTDDELCCLTSKDISDNVPNDKTSLSDGDKTSHNTSNQSLSELASENNVPKRQTSGSSSKMASSENIASLDQVPERSAGADPGLSQKMNSYNKSILSGKNSKTNANSKSDTNTQQSEQRQKYVRRIRRAQSLVPLGASKEMLYDLVDNIDDDAFSALQDFSATLNNKEVRKKKTNKKKDEATEAPTITSLVLEFQNGNYYSDDSVDVSRESNSVMNYNGNSESGSRPTENRGDSGFPSEFGDQSEDAVEVIDRILDQSENVAGLTDQSKEETSTKDSSEETVNETEREPLEKADQSKTEEEVTDRTKTHLPTTKSLDKLYDRTYQFVGLSLERAFTDPEVILQNKQFRKSNLAKPSRREKTGLDRPFVPSHFSDKPDLKKSQEKRKKTSEKREDRGDSTAPPHQEPNLLPRLSTDSNAETSKPKELETFKLPTIPATVAKEYLRSKTCVKKDLSILETVHKYRQLGRLYRQLDTLCNCSSGNSRLHVNISERGDSSYDVTMKWGITDNPNITLERTLYTKEENSSAITEESRTSNEKKKKPKINFIYLDEPPTTMFYTQFMHNELSRFLDLHRQPVAKQLKISSSKNAKVSYGKRPILSRRKAKVLRRSHEKKVQF